VSSADDAATASAPPARASAACAIANASDTTLSCAYWREIVRPAVRATQRARAVSAEADAECDVAAWYLLPRTDVPPAVPCGGGARGGV
jgi:hypothetical protein